MHVCVRGAGITGQPTQVSPILGEPEEHAAGSSGCGLQQGPHADGADDLGVQWGQGGCTATPTPTLPRQQAPDDTPGNATRGHL